MLSTPALLVEFELMEGYPDQRKRIASKERIHKSSCKKKTEAAQKYKIGGVTVCNWGGNGVQKGGVTVCMTFCNPLIYKGLGASKILIILIILSATAEPL